MIKLCSTCGKPAEPNRSMCEEHLRKRREYASLRRKSVCDSCGGPREIAGFCKICWNKRRDSRKELLNQKKLKGECISCVNPAVNGQVYCETCRQKANDRVMLKKQKYRTNGLCENCGKSPSGKSNLCQNCFAKETSSRHFKTVSKTDELVTLFERQNSRCPYTGKALILGENSSLDHTIPKSKGGANDVSNVQWVYFGSDFDVNKMKFDMTDEQFKEAIRQLAQWIFNIEINK